MRRPASTLLVLAALIAPAAANEASPARRALKASCTGDYLEHCGEHPPGGPEVEACFRTNQRLLSPPCAGAIEAYRREQAADRRVTQTR